MQTAIVYKQPKIDLTGVRVMGKPIGMSYAQRLAQRERLDLKPIRA